MYTSRSDRTPTESRLDILPNEVLDMVLEYSNGLTSLYALTRAHNQACALFERRPTKMMSQAFLYSSMESQLEEIFCMIIAVRLRHKYGAADGSLRTYIDAVIENTSTAYDLDLSFFPVSQAMNALGDIVDIYDSIYKAERSFVRTTIPKITARIQSKVAEKRYYRSSRYPVIQSLKERRPSPTELYRIRRALWHLRLYFEAYLEPFVASAACALAQTSNSTYCSEDQRGLPSKLWSLSYEEILKYIQSQKVFFYHSRAWELEEMECVWYHLRYQGDTLWRRHCPDCQRLQLPDDLVRHMKECKVMKWVANDASFAKAWSWFRMHLGDHPTGHTTAYGPSQWPRSLARQPNAGYTFLLERSDEIRPHRGPPSIIRGPLQEFLGWGYCIWDRERLEAWRLLDSQDGKVPAVLNWWGEDRWRREE